MPSKPRPATSLATALMGDAIATNLFLVGYAFQLGRIPVSLGAFEQAIALNGRQIEMNKRAFSWGRLAAHDLDRVRELARPLLRGDAATGEAQPRTRQGRMGQSAEELRLYAGRGLAKRYRKFVDGVAERETALGIQDDALSSAVARYYYKLLAVKDEFEVARLWTDGSFQRQLALRLAACLCWRLAWLLPLRPSCFLSSVWPLSRLLPARPSPWLLHCRPVACRPVTCLRRPGISRLPWRHPAPRSPWRGAGRRSSSASLRSDPGLPR